MSDSLDEIVGSFPDLPDCQDPFTDRIKTIYRTRDRFAHMDGVLRECAAAEDPIYRAAAALWEAIAGKTSVQMAGRRCSDCAEMPDDGTCEKCGDSLYTTKDAFVANEKAEG